MNLGENIYSFRTRKKLSQEALAEALEVSRQSVSKWENNSAVPELDKLMKMADIFEISLDELVGKVPPAPASCETAPESQEEPPIEGPTTERLPRETAHGVSAILVVSTVGLTQVLASESHFDAVELLFLMLPLLLCGIVWITTRHPGFYCGWIGAGGYWLYLFLLSHRWEEQTLLLFLGVALVIGMVVCSIRLHRRGTIRIPGWAWILGALFLTAAGILLLMNTVEPFWIGSSSITSSTVS